MNPRIRILILSAVFLCLAADVFADSVVLKSGLRVEGKIIKRTRDKVVIDFDGVNLFYDMNEVERINGEPVRWCPTSPRAPSKECPRAEGPMVMFPDEGVFINPCDQPALVVFLVGFAIALIVGASLFYVYFAVCLLFIAKKTATQPEWLALVPVANLFFMCKLAGVTCNWLFVLALWILPVIGPIANVTLFTFFWYKIARVRNKSGWLGILTPVPVVNLIVMGYLAFSE